MKTTHTVHIGDSQEMNQLADDTVDLVVTSPPYPMIEMWDDVFTSMNSTIQQELNANNGDAAFELMHHELDRVWEEIDRVTTTDAIVCINIGDATRTIDDTFSLYSNHARITTKFTDLGFNQLPGIIWRKPTNSAAKFMGSGMMPPNAYVTLEHEHILVFRKNGTRTTFSQGTDIRYESSYFWEERNTWFSDLWTDILGEQQTLPSNELRDRSAAYPFEIPHRLINMYSVHGDTVLDPFFGTGTTAIAAITAARNSIGYEIVPEFANHFRDRLTQIQKITRDVSTHRLRNHQQFVQERRNNGNEFKYTSEHYNFPVTTKAEKQLRLYNIEAVTEKTDQEYHITHTPVTTPHTSHTPTETSQDKLPNWNN